jgi:hypothetical protein
MTIWNSSWTAYPRRFPKLGILNPYSRHLRNLTLYHRQCVQLHEDYTAFIQSKELMMFFKHEKYCTDQLLVPSWIFTILMSAFIVVCEGHTSCIQFRYDNVSETWDELHNPGGRSIFVFQVPTFGIVSRYFCKLHRLHSDQGTDVDLKL